MSQNDFGKWLKEQREKAGYDSQSSLAQVSGVDNSTIARLERNETMPTPKTLKKLAPHLKVSYEQLMIAAGHLPNKALPDDAIPVGEMVRIPVYGEIRAGEPAFVREEIIDWTYIPAWQVKGGDYFYLRVKGDSMEGERILDGDYVLVRRQPTLEDGDIGVVSIIGESAGEYGSEATIKKFYRSLLGSEMEEFLTPIIMG